MSVSFRKTEEIGRGDTFTRIVINGEDSDFGIVGHRYHGFNHANYISGYTIQKGGDFIWKWCKRFDNPKGEFEQIERAGEFCRLGDAKTWAQNYIIYLRG